MRFSDECGKIMPKLLAVQKACLEVKKDAVNPHFGNNYATLDAVLDTARPVLNDNGLLVTQCKRYQTHTCEGGDTHILPGSIIIVTRITDTESGEWVEGDTYMPVAKETAQGYGGAATYGRRYGLMDILCLAPEDDDGNEASGSGGGSKRKAAPVTQQESEDMWETAGPDAGDSDNYI